ncbi:MAG TPA: hypothetical protein VFG69_10760, partial [Nannocystaceae bacterium]|nr:hypothetical protein [Nannocystaceae bacterium]
MPPSPFGAVVLAIGVALLACRPGANGSGAAVEPTPTAAAEPSAPMTAPVASSSDALDPATARAEARKILESVSLARNLPLKRDVEVDVISKQGIRKF